MLLTVAGRTFGENMKRERKRRGVTQLVLAEWLGLKQSQVSAWERGDRSPNKASVTRIAEALSTDGPPCSPKDLLAGILTDHDELRGATVPDAPPPADPVLTQNEVRALKLLNDIPVETQPFVLAGLEAASQTLRHERRLKSAARAAQSSARKDRKAGGRR